jgi:ferredoxin
MTTSFTIRLLQQAWAFSATPEQTLLEAAQAAGIRIVNSCRNGTCRTCMCQMRSGQVHYRIEWPGLSFDEKQDGYILPCVAYPDTDIELDHDAVFKIDAAL